MAAGLDRACPGLVTVQIPIADGGDGTVDAAEAAGYRRVEMGVRGPTSLATSRPGRLRCQRGNRHHRVR